MTQFLHAFHYELLYLLAIVIVAGPIAFILITVPRKSPGQVLYESEKRVHQPLWRELSEYTRHNWEVEAKHEANNNVK